MLDIHLKTIHNKINFGPTSFWN